MKKICTILTFVLVAVALYGQNRIKVEAPNLVAADEQFNVTFIVEGENAPGDFQWSPSDDFQLVWGPQRGTSTSISIINGKRTKSSQSSYTYVLLPKKAGSFTLPAATATIKGDKISSGTVTVEVVSAGASSSSSQSASSQQTQQQKAVPQGEIASDDLFLRFTLSKSRAVVGEPITATLKLYQRVNIAGFEDARFPTFNGFWSQEVQTPTNIEFHRENIGDRIYNAAVLRSYVIIPQQSGELAIDPAEIVCLVNVRTHSSSSGSIFDSFFQDDYRTIRKRVSTQPYTVKVSPLPSGAPASFGGGVGNFSMQASLSRDSLQAHDAASLKITISGKGNVSLLEAPKINFPPDFEVYDVKTTENTDKSSGRTSGSKTFEYPFIPRSHGNFVLGPVEYSYFDVNSGRYSTLRSEPMSVSVSRGAETEVQGPAQVQTGVNRRDVRDLGSDIRYIRTKASSLSEKGSFFVFSTIFWILFVLVFASGAAIWFALEKKAELKADVAGTKNRVATKMARKRLANAGEFLKRDLPAAYYEELHKALLGYAGDKLNIDPAGMSKDNISARLQENGALEADVKSYMELLDECEVARYSPNAGQNAMNEQYEKAVSVISAIDASLRKPVNVRKVIPMLLIFLCLPLGAGNWEDGVAAYEEGRYAEAAEYWSAIESEGLQSVDLYYNLGNAWFKCEDYARAILYYERALRLDPSDDDVAHNLEFAKTFTQDRIEEIPEMMIEQIGRRICRTLPSDSWTVLFFIFLSVAIACALLYLLSGVTSRRKAGFFAGIVMLALSLLCLDFAQWQWSDYNKDTSAIVMTPVCAVKSSPSETSSKDLFVLHEGTKIKIMDEVGDWAKIELSDGRQGWSLRDNLELI